MLIFFGQILTNFGVFKKLDTFGLAYVNWKGLVYDVLNEWFWYIWIDLVNAWFWYVWTYLVYGVVNAWFW
jgi:hypothetical protein